MSIIATKYISQVQSGDIISDDIYVDKVLLVKAGTLLNTEVIEKLELWGVSKIQVLHPEYRNNPALLDTVLKETTAKKSIFLLSKEVIDKKQLFYESLQYVVNESRYGVMLHSEHQMRWLEKLFVAVVSDTKIYSGLVTLKKVDPYTYFHSFDVFLLGTVLADKVGVSNIHLFSASCLIHDIGKLKISRELLQKEDKLSKSDFESIQAHTVIGAKWIKDKQLPSYYEILAKSHHERLDGSGYPEGLSGDQISNEVRILSIVDTYSALTLKRPYREPFSAAKAVELLMSKPTKYDNHFLIKFIELLNIYPVNSIVTLSNGKTMRVSMVNDSHPYLPVLEELDKSSSFQLPTNLSITIPRFISWEELIQWEDNRSGLGKSLTWNNYLTHLVYGNRAEAIETFKEITEGMTAEKIFIDVIVKSIKEIELKWAEGHLSVGEEHDALLTIKDLFDITLSKINEEKQIKATS